MKRTRRAAKAYHLYAGGEGTWEEIARRVGYHNKASAYNGARRYAERNDQPWPLKGEHRGSRLAQAYHLYSKSQLGWDAVANEVGYASGASARICARRYALQQDLPWPPRQQTQRSPRAHNHNIRHHNGTAAEPAVSDPTGSGRIERGALLEAGQEAYELGAGGPRSAWRAVAEALGYDSGDQAYQDAHQYAQRHGLRF